VGGGTKPLNGKFLIVHIRPNLHFSIGGKMFLYVSS
jgi:hypothetical protein